MNGGSGPTNEGIHLQVTCPMCRGSGEILDPGGLIKHRLVTCSNCNGKGVLCQLVVPKGGGKGRGVP
jgi:hypothetical protein